MKRTLALAAAFVALAACGGDKSENGAMSDSAAAVAPATTTGGETARAHRPARPAHDRGASARSTGDDGRQRTPRGRRRADSRTAARHEAPAQIAARAPRRVRRSCRGGRAGT